MKKTLVLILGLMVVAGILGGCSKNTSSNIAEMSVRGDTTDKRIIINQNLLANKITFSEMDVRRVGDILQARVELTNNKKNTIKIAYRFEWFDEDGFPISSGVSIWKNGWLKGHQQLSLVGTAPSANAVDVKLHLREVE